MFPKSASPRFVFCSTLLMAISLIIPLLRVERALIESLALREDQYAGPLSIPICMFVSLYLVPRILQYLGIRVRGRSVERLQAVDRDEGREGAVAPPIRIVRGERIIPVIPAAFYLAGVAFFVLAWALPAPDPRDPWAKTIALLSIATILTFLGFLVGRARPELLCEVSEKGIRAPDGFWGRQTFVPWGELNGCEIIHDDEKVWHDYFFLRDRAGRLRFKSSKRWMGRLRRSERIAIFRALRCRFPHKAKGDQDREPTPARATPSAVWDRELDG